MKSGEALRDHKRMVRAVRLFIANGRKRDRRKAKRAKRLQRQVYMANMLRASAAVQRLGESYAAAAAQVGRLAAAVVAPPRDPREEKGSG